MVNEQIINKIVKRILDEAVIFSKDVQPDNETYLIGDRIERKLKYEYSLLNTEFKNAMYKAPLIDTYPRPNKKQFMCNIRFTANSVSVDKNAMMAFVSRYLENIKKHFEYEILKQPYFNTKAFNRTVGSVNGTVNLYVSGFSILVTPNFPSQKEQPILQHVPNKREEDERRRQKKFQELDRKLFGNKPGEIQVPKTSEEERMRKKFADLEKKLFGDNLIQNASPNPSPQA